MGKNPGITYELFRSGTGAVISKIDTELETGMAAFRAIKSTMETAAYSPEATLVWRLPLDCSNFTSLAFMSS